MTTQTKVLHIVSAVVIIISIYFVTNLGDGKKVDMELVGFYRGIGSVLAVFLLFQAIRGFMGKK